MPQGGSKLLDHAGSFFLCHYEAAQIRSQSLLLLSELDDLARAERAAKSLLRSNGE